MKKLVTKKCKTCTKEFSVIPCREHTAKYCSKKCLFNNPEVVDKKNKSLKGLPKSEDWKKKASANKMMEKNPMWKGDDVGKSALHLWLKDHLPKPKFCEECNKVPPKDIANISQEYKRELSDWEWLCRRCHMTKDGRMKNLKQFSNK